MLETGNTKMSKPGPLYGGARSLSIDGELVDEVQEAMILYFSFSFIVKYLYHKIIYLIYMLRNSNKRTEAGHQLCY